MTNGERAAKKLLGIERRKHILELLDEHGALTGLELVRQSQRDEWLPVNSEVFLRRSVVFGLLARMEKEGDIEWSRVGTEQRVFRRRGR